MRTRIARERMGASTAPVVTVTAYEQLAAVVAGAVAAMAGFVGAGIDPPVMLSTGYAFQVETTQLAYLMGKRIEQVPFVFSERIAGESKMSLAVSLEGIRVTLELRRRATSHRGGLPAV